MNNSPIQKIQAYFSHSYRSGDRSVNLFFWKLFSQEGFFFTIDPQSDLFVIAHLERMMRFSDCFIAVVTRRPGEEEAWTHSPYIAFENFLAEVADKPRLVFVEEGVKKHVFGMDECVQIFVREKLESREKQLHRTISEFAEKTRSYMSFYDQIAKRTGKAGILIEEGSRRSSYSKKIIRSLEGSLDRSGYASEVIPPRIDSFQQFVRELSELEFIVLDVRQTPLDVLAAIQAKAIPCIRLAKLGEDESATTIKLPSLLRDYTVAKETPVIDWKTESELIERLSPAVKKFTQARTSLDTFEKGEKYFQSAGRKSAKIFISHSSSQDDLASYLVEELKTLNIQYFQYKSSIATGTAWKQELEKQLQSFDIFVALIDDEYHNKEWCQHELGKAFERWQKNEVMILPYLVTRTRLPDLIKEDIQCTPMGQLSEIAKSKEIATTIDEYLRKIEAEPKGDGTGPAKRVYYGKGNKWAVLVGVNKYDDVNHYSPLQVCVKDVLALKQQLLGNGYESQRIKILTDQGDELPSRENILVALKTAASVVELDDLLIFYYSGHGVERNGESYLVGRNGMHLVIEDTGVPISKIKEIMQSSAARAKIIVLDACHSGASLGKGSSTMTEEFIKRVFEQAEGFAIMASCKQGEVSYEWRENDCSVFTHFLLEALQGEADRDNKNFVTIQDVNRYVCDGVKLWASQKNLIQTPTLQYQAAGDIILARLSA